MQVPLELTFRDVPHSDAIDALVRRYVQRLERFCDHIESCSVAIERPHRPRNSGSDFRVRIDMVIPPGHELVVSKDASDRGTPPAPQNFDSLHALVREAFEAANRQVKKLNEQQAGKTKRHPQQEIGAVISRLSEDHGFLRTTDGRDVYFHRNSVVNEDFNQLREGEGVAYAEEVGEQGWQASSVRVVDHRGH
jgi:cold shock CspA family protein